MKKTIINSFTFGISILWILMGILSSCSDREATINPLIDNTQIWTFPTTINVQLPKAATRVAYTDNGSSGVKQSWETGDQFILYNCTGDSVLYTVSTINSSDASKATFTLNSNESAISGVEFYAVYKTDKIGVSFTTGSPVYNLDMTGQIQSGSGSDALSHLKQYDLISSEPITDLTQTITFTSKGTLLTFTIASISNGFGAPTSLTISAIGASDDVFQTNYNASPNISDYTLDLSGYDASTTSLTAYIMLPPFTLPANSSLAVLLESASNELRYVGNFTTAKSYTAAVRYNFPISSFAGFDTYTQEMDALNAYYDDGWGTKYKPEVGDGTQSNPYQIATAWNLAWLKAIIINSASYNNSDIYYKLTTNITIEDGMDWKPIGPSTSFKANFDGNNNEVVNFQISNSNSHAGFFGIVEGSTINNFTIKGNISASSTGGSYFGGVTGLAINASIKGCDNYVNVTNSGGRSTGGIAGSIQSNTVMENCNNYGLISGNEDVGGITGSYTSYVDGAKINNCNNYNIVKGNHQGIGGILGDSQGASIPLSYCTNEADIDGGTSGRLVGGIVGEGYASAITYCSNSGNITGSSNFVGAILGQNFGGTLSSTNTNTGTANGTDTLIGSGY